MIGFVEFEIKKNYKKFRPSERKVADYLLQNLDKVEQMTITSLAEEAKVSQPTVMRFANSLGMKGFKELKYLLMQDEVKKLVGDSHSSPLHGFQIQEQDRLEDIPSNIIATTIKTMQDTLSSISVEEYVKLVEAIIHARKVFVFGVENSNSTVSDLVTKLMYLGIDCVTYTDYYLQSICASNLTSDDVAIGISYSGCSKNTVDVLKAAAESGAVTAAITNFEKSVLSKYANICITSTTEQYLYGEAIFSRASQLAIVDMIYTGVIISNYHHYTAKMDKSSRAICSRAYEE